MAYIYGTADDDVFHGDDDDGVLGNDTIWGYGGNDRLYGHDGQSDYLIGGEGADIIDGGDGSDITDYRTSSAGVTINLATGRGYGGEAESDRLYSIEWVIGSNHNDTLMGDERNNEFSGADGNDILKGYGGDDSLYGDKGDDTLKGAGGADTLNGGEGSDTVAYQELQTRVFVSLLDNIGSYGDAEGDTYEFIENITGSAYNDDLWGHNGANALNGNSGNDKLKGFGGADTLRGEDGDDVMDGGTSYDSMVGGRGNDLYFVDNGSDRVTERAGEGIDVVRTSVTYGLFSSDEIEVLETTDANGTSAISLFGNQFVQTIIGNNGANLLSGGGGGADQMVGRGGNDTYNVDNVGNQVIESAGQGNDTVRTAISWTLTAGSEVELLTTVSENGTSAINLFGNAFANTVRGNNGNNIISGGAGADTMQGLDGNDSYLVDNAADVIVDSAGVDNVSTSVSYTLAANVAVETLRTTNAAGTTPLYLFGNNLANIVTGNAGNNIISGGGGIDKLQGLAGDDSYVVDNAADVVVDTAGVDNVNASVSYTLAAGVAVETLRIFGGTAGTAAINLTGNELANTVTGNAGSNAINGGLGNDKLTGNAGNDFFVFNTVLNASTNVDTIVDFVVANDTARLDNAVFTGLAVGTLNADAFHIGTAAADAEDRIVYNSATGALSFDANGTGAGGLVKFAQLGTNLALTNADFVIV